MFSAVFDQNVSSRAQYDFYPECGYNSRGDDQSIYFPENPNEFHSILGNTEVHIDHLEKFSRPLNLRGCGYKKPSSTLLNHSGLITLSLSLLGIVANICSCTSAGCERNFNPVNLQWIHICLSQWYCYKLPSSSVRALASVGWWTSLCQRLLSLISDGKTRWLNIDFHLYIWRMRICTHRDDIAFHHLWVNTVFQPVFPESCHLFCRCKVSTLWGWGWRTGSSWLFAFCSLWTLKASLFCAKFASRMIKTSSPGHCREQIQSYSQNQ